MEFDKSRIYTSLNADELKVGSKVIVANNIDSLKCKVQRTILNECDIMKVKNILDESNERRFQLTCKGTYPLAYLVSEPEEKKLKWTDLKLGDVIRKKYEDGYRSAIVIRFDTYSTEKHIGLGDEWLTDKDLENWERVKNENETV